MAGVYTVKQVNSYIKNMFKQDFLLNSVSVKGEISNCKYHTSGHIYFTLKDADAALSVIMFASQAAKLVFKLKDGMSVVVSGRVDVFDAAGKYQLYANTVQQEGIGELYQKFEQLKQYYEDMGYFAKEYKRPLPAFTKKLGVI
ncbi:MAG: exodeoxyribonuclease VII large subunit [Lachnospira eligens]